MDFQTIFGHDLYSLNHIISHLRRFGFGSVFFSVGQDSVNFNPNSI